MAQTGTQRSGPSGQKKAFTPQQVGYLITLLSDDVTMQKNNARRNLALFRTAVCTMLRASDIMALRVSDVWSLQFIRSELLLAQQKTRRNVECALQEETRFALYNYLISKYGTPAGVELNLTHPLFELSKRQYGTIVKEWAKRLGLDPRFYNTHSLRRTKAREVYARTKNLEFIRQLLGQTSLRATSAYLGVEKEDALAASREVKF